MFFDCLALGMGLLASVMATWPRNETFTYGCVNHTLHDDDLLRLSVCSYARVETLSGFANGVFLILISIFIVFEAIQRLIDPPEMNTNQLLVVSMAGLAVNLVGMFATGHHHHGHSVSSAVAHGAFGLAHTRTCQHGGHDHGHSHGHDHDHAHGHAHGRSSKYFHYAGLPLIADGARAFA
jgi:zinc transporter 5/7